MKFELRFRTNNWEEFAMRTNDIDTLVEKIIEKQQDELVRDDTIIVFYKGYGFNLPICKVNEDHTEEYPLKIQDYYDYINDQISEINIYLLEI